MELSKEVHDELVTTYAALVLYDGDAEINAEQLTTVIEASGNEVRQIPGGLGWIACEEL